MIMFISDKICVTETQSSFEACQKMDNSNNNNNNEDVNKFACVTVSGV